MRAAVAAGVFLLGCPEGGPLDDDDDDTAAPTPDPCQATPAAGWEDFSGIVTDELEESSATGAVVIVWQGDAVLFTGGFGERHPDDGGEVRCDTLFRIGSVTKMTTAIAALQAVARGNLDLDASVQDVLPEFDMRYDSGWTGELTLRQLLTHQGGFWDWGRFDDGADEQLADTFEGYFEDNVWLMARPGAFWNYANPNFSLAGLLVETVDERPYRTIVEEDVYRALGMERTFFLADDVLADGNWAAGETRDWTDGVGSAIAEPDSYDSGFMRPAGFAWSSVHDLMRLGQFLMHGDAAVLDAAQHEAMVAPQVSMDYVSDWASYGYGVLVTDGFFLGEDWIEERLVHHDGDLYGFAADLYTVPRLDFGIAVLASGDGAHLGGAISEALSRADLAAATDPPSEIFADPSTFAELDGEWDDPWNTGPMTVTSDADSVTVSLPNLDELDIPYVPELTPVWRDVFVFTVQDYPLAMTFLRDDAGMPIYARTRSFVHNRVDGQARSSPDLPDRDTLIARIAAASEAEWRAARLPGRSPLR